MAVGDMPKIRFALVAKRDWLAQDLSRAHLFTDLATAQDAMPGVAIEKGNDTVFLLAVVATCREGGAPHVTWVGVTGSEAAQ